MRILVLIPMYNEAENIGRVLKSIISQTLKPSMIIIGDNDSTDNSVEIAKEVLEDSGISYRILKVRRYPELQKLNINNVLYYLDRFVKSSFNPKLVDFISIIESDIVLERGYFEKTTAVLRGAGERACISAGRLEPLGFPNDPFPLPVNKNLWGSNRVYTYKCWRLLNDLIDIRLLPLWDTDHVVLAYLLGMEILRVENARSFSLRGINKFTGKPRGIADGLHGLPFWWIIFKALQRMDPGYLNGYILSHKFIKKNLMVKQSKVLEYIRSTYRQGAYRVLIQKLGLV